MIVNLNAILPEARKEKKAVGAFNVYNYETIKGVILAASELKTPVIVAFGERYLQNMSFEEVYSLTKTIAEQHEVKTVLHLDHCKSTNNIINAIKANFSSVMFDGSLLPFSENLRKTKEVVEIAHSYGVTVEAELGSIASGTFSSEEGSTEIYTDPGQAEEFVKETQIDALAVSIGTVHGMYKGEPKINIEVLREIAKRVEIPLVLHGGSGTPEEIIKECIRNGISKININTEVSMNVVAKINELLSRNGISLHFSDISKEVTNCVKEVAKKYISMFYFSGI